MTMTRLVVDTADPTPPYEQLRRQLVALLGAGALAPGDRLPPVRQLAADLGLATGTVARTYRELEQAGLVVSRAGRGTAVAQGVAPVAPADRARELARLAEGFVGSALLLGAGPDAITAAVADALHAR